jgi:hypothetical protein
MLGMTGPASAQEKEVGLLSGQPGPFEISKQNCIEKGWIDKICLTTNEASGVVPIQRVIDELNTTIERMRQVNGWGEEVTSETLIPIGSTFAFAGRGI